ncbi:MAG: DUF4167 domain-containing protein [Hyphomicrobiales bacterium]|nr:DUF4167 domain-containing protein [Hyphomicrobiales bacterium]MCP5370690.1 DUF4167 domain-containing protein [Hyphomicrobiales bacterium]
MKHSSSTRRGRSRGNGKRHPAQKNNYESNGPDVKIRGTAQQVLEKYLALGRDATSSGDRIAAEAYFQHAEHYFRLINNAEAQNQLRQQRGRSTPQNGGDGFDDGDGDGDGDDQGMDSAAMGPDDNDIPGMSDQPELPPSITRAPQFGKSAERRASPAEPQGGSDDGDGGDAGDATDGGEGTRPRRRGPGRPRRAKGEAGGDPSKETAPA